MLILSIVMNVVAPTRDIVILKNNLTTWIILEV